MVRSSSVGLHLFRLILLHGYTGVRCLILPVHGYTGVRCLILPVHGYTGVRCLILPLFPCIY